MDRRKVNSVTVEYDDGSVEVHAQSDMSHRVDKIYRKGDTKTNQGYFRNTITWTEENGDEHPT